MHRLAQRRALTFAHFFSNFCFYYCSCTATTATNLVLVMNNHLFYELYPKKLIVYKTYTMNKEEKPDLDVSKVKVDIFQLIQAYENGVSEVEVSRTMPNTPSAVRMDAINQLTIEGKVQLCKRGSELIYRAIDSKTASNLAAFSNLNISIEERAVYRVIELSGNRGIWNKDIRTQTKLPLTQLSKVLKNLETKKLIKAVKSVAASKRKVYMLYDLEPDKSVTGGAWYSETEFDSSFVTVLHEQCLKFVRKKLESCNLVSSFEVKEHIESSKISNIELSIQDIEMVLDTIVFDGLIEKVVETTSKMEISDDESDCETNYYRAISQLVESSNVTRVPCAQCPHFSECRPGAVISPEQCLYLERWFES